MANKGKGKGNNRSSGKKGARAEGGPWRTPGSAETGALGSETAGPGDVGRRKGKARGK